MRGKDKERESFFSRVSWVEIRNIEARKRKRRSIVSLKEREIVEEERREGRYGF